MKAGLLKDLRLALYTGLALQESGNANFIRGSASQDLAASGAAAGNSLESRLAMLTQGILILAIFVALLLMAVNFSVEGRLSAAMWVVAASLPLLLILLGFALRGHTNAVALVLVGLLYLMTIGLVITRGTVYSAGCTLILLVAAMAGLMLDRRSMLVALAAGVLILGGLCLAEYGGSLRTPALGSLFSYWLSISSFAVVTCVALSYGRRVADDALIRASNEIAERREVEHRLRQSEAHHRTLFESIADAVLVLDPDAVIDCNPAAARMFGVGKREGLLGRHPGELSPGAQMDGEASYSAAKRRIEQARSQGSLAFEWLHRRLDSGKVFHADVLLSRVEVDGHACLQATVRDISERKRMESVRASLEAQLREAQKMQAIGTLAGGIAHDFNNIIATILGNAELARQDQGANPQALESLEEIGKAGRRGRELVRQILAFSRRQPTERKPVALAPIIGEAARLLRATLPARLALEVRCDETVPTVLADANQIEQVLINLATNAMQAMRDGPGRIVIGLDTVVLDAALASTHPALGALHARRPGRAARLAVSDTGQGMDAATLERIFEPFFTTKAVDEGTGLGLSVVHGIVQAHEGAIVANSQPGKGAVFTVYLPAMEAKTGGA